MPVQKVWLYVLRRRAKQVELLVFEHMHVDAGIQVPAGTVEPNEDLECAAHRELWEESGVRVPQLHPIGEMERIWDGKLVHAHWFAGWAADDLPDTWMQHVTGSGDDKNMQFRCYWLSHDAWEILYGDFKRAYPQLKNWIAREFTMETK